MSDLLIIVAAAAGLYGLHRAAVWAERRGWIHYRTKVGRGHGVGNACLEVQSMIEPSKRYVLEERLKDASEEAEAGDPPTPASGECRPLRIPAVEVRSKGTVKAAERTADRPRF